MSRMPHLSRQGKRPKKSRRLGEPEVIKRDAYEAMELDSRLELIRTLIPLGLMAVCEELEREVVRLAGARHSRKAGDPKHYRHGTNPGTVRLAGQRVPIEVPRVRGPEREVRLRSYDEMHGGSELDEFFSVGFSTGSRAGTTSERRRRFRTIRERRRELIERGAPESEFDALFREQREIETPMFASMDYAGRVRAFEGAAYEATGLYRPEIDCIMFSRNEVGFCRVCRWAIERVIGLYAGN